MQFQLVGRISKEVSCPFEDSNTPNAEISIADVEARKSGEEFVTSFFNVTVWGKSAETALNSYKKGDLVFVSGRCHVETYEKDGAKKWITKYTASTIRKLSASKKQDAPAPLDDGFDMMEAPL